MNFSTLVQYITPHRKVLGMVILLLLAGSALSLAQPWLAGQLTSVLLRSEAATMSLENVLLFWLLVIVLRSITGFLSHYYIGSTGERMTANLRTRLFQHLQILPIAYYHQHRSGDVLSLLSHDAEYISSFVTDTLVRLLPLLLTFAGALLMMVLLDPVIAALAALLLPGYFLVMKVIGRRIRPVSRAWVDAYGRLVAFIDENLDMRPTIKSFTREETEQQHFNQHNSHLLNLSRQQLFIESLLSPAVGLLSGLGLLLMLWLGSAHVTTGQLTAPELVSLLLYAMLLTQPLRGLADVYGQFQRTRGAAERAMEFLGEQAEPDDSGLPDLGTIVGAIAFEGVDFHYAGGNPVLSNFHLKIAAGETVALTGPNGAGKSTVVHLLLRLADPGAGQISIDGVNIAHASIASLRRQIGLVAQHTLLINGSVAENIAYGRPLVSTAEIEQAAMRAHAHDFITQLPDGYATQIGDQGLRLSGGQRQRISLARTLLLNPPVLILDEATSMFDPEGEQGFIDECRTLLGGKTVILITHRPASLALADRVIEMKVASKDCAR